MPFGRWLVRPAKTRLNLFLLGAIAALVSVLFVINLIRFVVTVLLA